MSLMQISRRVDYALRAAIHLSRQVPERATSVAEMSRLEAIPRKFLEKIIQDLIHAGIVVSRRGAHGGYALSRPAERISFREVMEAVEGPITLNVCVGDPHACSLTLGCSMHHVWSEGQRRLVSLFEETKLSALVAPLGLSSTHPARTEIGSASAAE